MHFPHPSWLIPPGAEGGVGGGRSIFFLVLCSVVHVSLETDHHESDLYALASSLPPIAQNFDDTLVRWADKQPFKFLLKLLKFETALEPHAGMRMITQGMVTFLDQVNRPAGALAYLWRDAEAAKGAGPAPSPPSRASLSLDRSDRPEGPVGPVDVHVHAVSRSSISSQLTVSVRGGASVGGHAYKGEVQGLPEAFARVRKCFEGHVLEAFAA